tara:strand:+ start:46 stop:480 length:435 start_codon:yes stop_codon:yes gene_type:complete
MNLKTNKIVGAVYFGASFLILIVGIRALVQAGAFGEVNDSILTPITLIALAFEFAMLSLYAYTIFKSDSNSLEGANESSSINVSDESLDALSKSLKANTKLMKDYNENLENISSKLELITSNEMSKKITEETRKILQKSLDNLK